jgi:uncharacterized membrane protein
MSERSRRRWLVLGVLSAVLNVFLIGFLAGRQAFGPGGCGPRGVMRGGSRAAFHERVKPEDRARLRQLLGDVRQSREQVRAALRREPYDPAQLEAALSGLRKRSADVQEDMHRVLLESASKLSPEERRRLADSRLLRKPLGLSP